MRRSAIILCLLICYTLACKPKAEGEVKFYSPEADYGYVTAKLQMVMKRDPVSPEMPLHEIKNSSFFNAQIKQHQKYLMGALRHQVQVEGSIQQSYSYEINDIKNFSPGSSDKIIVDYTLREQIVFPKGSFPRMPLQVLMPLSVDQFYQRGVLQGKQTCSTVMNASPDRFWYDWVPKAGCPYQMGTDVQKVSLQFVAADLTRLTYPEYERMFLGRRDDNSVKIEILLGKGEAHEKVHYDYAFAELKKMIKTRLEGSDVLIDVPDNFGLKKRLKRFDVNVSVRGIESDVKANDSVSEGVLKAALETSDVFIYSGHSGMGKNLDVNRFKNSLNLNPNKYQIYFFNSCYSFSYFTADFFKLKNGTKNLEIVSTGKLSEMRQQYALVSTFLDQLWRTQYSWQEILDAMKRAAGNESPMISVSGDEDNPKDLGSFAPAASP